MEPAGYYSLPDYIAGWKFEKKLGSGSFGIVTLWKEQSMERYVAIKQCVGEVKDAKVKDRWIKEVELINKLHHSNLIGSMYRVVPEEMIRKLTVKDLPPLTMEYCTGGDLRSLLRKSENCCGLHRHTLLNVLSDVFDGIVYLHKNGVTHRDMKPENIVIKPGTNGRDTYKIIDLGCSKELYENAAMITHVGTKVYVAPELFLEKSYTMTVDLWAVGVMTFECITGSRPFSYTGDNFRTRLSTIKQKKDEIIYIHEVNGTIEQARKLPQPYWLCGLTAGFFENVIRLLLRTDSKNRGGGTVNDSPVWYSTMKSILNEKFLRVFDVQTSTTHSFCVKPDETVGYLLSLLHKNLSRSMTDALLLTSKGVALNSDSKLMEHAEFLQSCDNKMLFLFIKDFNGVIQKSHVITEVVQIVKEPSTLYPLADLRQIYKNCYYLCAHTEMYAAFIHQTTEAITHYTLRININFVKLMTNIEEHIHKLTIMWDNYHRSISIDVAQYRSFCDLNHIEPEQTLEQWAEKLNESPEFKQQLKKLDKIRRNKRSLDTVLTNLQQNRPCKTNHFIVQREKCVTEFEKLLKRIRAHDQTAISSEAMSDIIKAVMAKRSDVYKKAAKHISECRLHQDSIFKLMPHATALLVDLEDGVVDLSKKQEKHQQNVWELFQSTFTAHLSQMVPNLSSTSCQSEPTSPLSETEPHSPLPPVPTFLAGIVCSDACTETDLSDTAPDQRSSASGAMADHRNLSSSQNRYLSSISSQSSVDSKASSLALSMLDEGYQESMELIHQNKQRCDDIKASLSQPPPPIVPIEPDWDALQHEGHDSYPSDTSSDEESNT